MLRIIFAYLLALIAAIFGLWTWQKNRQEEIKNERLNDEIRRLNSARLKNFLQRILTATTSLHTLLPAQQLQ